MPVVVLEFGSAERALAGHMKLEEPQIHNIGNGPAFNIRVQTIAGPDLEVRFDSVPLLDKAGIEKLRFTIWQGKTTTGFSRRTVLLASVITSGQLGTEMRIAGVFADSAGTQYRASYVVRYDPDARETVTTFVGQHKMTS
jgi:hypothetical protein